jgi:hypothetical protein
MDIADDHGLDDWTRIRGVYQNGEILVGPSFEGDKTLLHESVHGAAAEKIQVHMDAKDEGNPSPLSDEQARAADDLVGVFEQVRGQIKDPAGSIAHSLSNVHDFLANAFVDPQTRTLLQSMPEQGRRWLLFLAAVVIAWSIADWLIR